MVKGVREQLVDIAERLAATRGLAATSLRDIQVESGQQNKSVVQYYFGSKAGLMEAIMDARMGPINLKRLAILEQLGEHPGLRDLVEAFVVPLAEVTVLERRSYWARFLLQGTFDPAHRHLVQTSSAASSFRAVRSRLIAELTDLPPRVRAHRVDRMVEFIVVALATAEESRAAGKLSHAAAVQYVADVVDMSCALLSAETRWN
jgi:AcrR family transcriptional regulator